jgi:hypothetical protein
MAGPAYLKGDFWRICEECGFKMRASQTKKRWDGLIVCDADFEERHPQDFVRGVIDRQTVPDPRPEPVMAAIGPLTTAMLQAASAGATTIDVESTVRFASTDRIGLLMDDGNQFSTTVSAVVDLTVLQISTALPSSISAGASVINYSAVSTPAL